MSHREQAEERGSAMVLTIFVLFLLSGMGIALLYVANADVKMNQASTRAKKAFYISEAGLEDARVLLAANNKVSANPASLDDELVAAAGGNGSMNFDVTLLLPTWSGGAVTGFTGSVDDVPLRSYTSFGGGWHAAYLTNDPIDIQNGDILDDTNDRVMITAIGAGTDRSVEVVQAIVERLDLPALPSTITLLGPDANWDGGSSGAKVYDGDDCDGAGGYTGIPGLSVPVVGTVGSDQQTHVQDELSKGGTYNSDGLSGDDIIDDLTTTADPHWTGIIDPLWRDCSYLQDLADVVKAAADYVCTTASPCSHWSSSTITTVTFVEGDVSLGPGDSGMGILWVTGTLTARGNTSWEGPIFLVGEGSFDRNGGGNGHTVGAMVLANIAGPDGIYGNGDDCTGPGPDAGMSAPTFQVSGGGNHDTIYCSDAINQAMYGLPLKVVSFRQR